MWKLLLASLNDDLFEAGATATGPRQPFGLLVKSFATQQFVPDAMTIPANDPETRTAVALV